MFWDIVREIRRPRIRKGIVRNYNVRKIEDASMYRDGGSIFFSYVGKDWNDYEFLLPINREKMNDPNLLGPDYLTPAIYLGYYNDGIIVENLSWAEANKFVFELTFLTEYEDEKDRFNMLKQVISENCLNAGR